MTARNYTVQIRPHGRTISASSERSVLDAALDAGLNLPHSCKSGHCSSCRARLVAGVVRYPSIRPPGLTEQEASEGFVLLCQARPMSDLVVEARSISMVAETEIKTLPCRIERLCRLVPDVMQVFLRLPSVETLHFQPGQYLDVLIEGGRRRSFSIASPPHDSQLLEMHVRHVPGGGFTEQLFGKAAEGALLRIEGPLGQFVYEPGEQPMILVAGGTGFAPLKAILRHVLERGIARNVHLYWGARTATDLYEEQLILDWMQRYPQLQFTGVLSEAPAEAGAHYRAGWVHEAVLADYPDMRPHTVYAAGPPAMIEAIRTTFPTRGLLPGQLHFDSFDYAPDSRRS